MNKQMFLTALRRKLSELPRDELEERITFYREMIDDRMEEGLSEEEAVAAIGSSDKIVAEILKDRPFESLKRPLGIWEIILLVLGSPVWIPLLIAGFAVVLSLYLSLWSVVISLWAVFGSLVGCALGCIIGGVVYAAVNHVATGILIVAAGIVCAGLSIFMFYGCKAATIGTIQLAKWLIRCSIKAFRNKEVAA